MIERTLLQADHQAFADSFVKAMESAPIEPDMFGSDTLKFSATQRLGTERSRLSQIQDGRWKVVSDYFK